MDNQNKPVLHPILQSSIDPTKVSATVTGFLTSIAGVVMIVATIYHFPLTPSQYSNFIQEFGAATSAIITVAGLAMTVFGLARKLFVKLFAKKPTV